MNHLASLPAPMAPAQLPALIEVAGDRARMRFVTFPAALPRNRERAAGLCIKCMRRMVFPWREERISIV